MSEGQLLIVEFRSLRHAFERQIRKSLRHPSEAKFDATRDAGLLTMSLNHARPGCNRRHVVAGRGMHNECALRG